jgi:hypothetical protein
MNAIRIKRKIDSETIHLPELKPFFGREVEILILDEASSSTSEVDRWKPLFDIAGNDLIDPDAYKELRAASMMPLHGWCDDIPEERITDEKETP